MCLKSCSNKKIVVMLFLALLISMNVYATDSSGVRDESNSAVAHFTQNNLLSKNNLQSIKGYQKLKEKFNAKTPKTVLSIKTVSSGEPKMRVIIRIQEPASRAKLLTNVPNNSALVDNLERQVIKQGAEVKRKVQRLHVLSAELTEKQFDALMQNNAGIDSVMEDIATQPNLSVSIPFIGGDIIHNAGVKGDGQAVAIFDTGIDSSHPFFSGRVVEEACFSSGDGHFNFSLCPNTQNKQVGKGAAHDCASTIGVVDCWHGTHVAGIAAGGNSEMSGVAPAAKIVAVQVYVYNPNSGRLYAYASDLLAAFDWLINESTTPNIAAVNMSLGGGEYSEACDDQTLLTDAINQLRTRGTATVISSGNDSFINEVSWPGCISSAITVGASGHDQDWVAYFSNISPLVDLLAPGDSIYSSIPGGVFASMSGTSMAAPHVTGAFAALKSAAPDTSVDQIEKILKTSGKPIFHPATGLQLPRINLSAAYQQLVGGGGNKNTCLTLPGIVTASVGSLANGNATGWSVFVPSTGLFRVSLTSNSVTSSNLIAVKFNGQTVSMAIASGQTAFVDFANVPAGAHILKIMAMSEGVNLTTLSVEQLHVDSSDAPLACQGNPVFEVPAVVVNDLMLINRDVDKVWELNALRNMNVRILLSSASSKNSRSLSINFNNMTVPISLDAGQVVPIDFPNVAPGTHDLIVTATSDNLILNKIEATTY